MAEISVFNPSLIGYLGGMGRAAQSLGGAMSAMGQTKLDLEKQAQDQKYRDDMYKLNLNADTRATEAVAQAQKDKFDAKNEKYATNAATNAYLMGIDAPQEMSNDYAKLSMIDPAMTAAALKQDLKDRYTATDGGLIYDKVTGEKKYDYRNSGGFGGKGVSHVDTIKNGQVMRTFMNPETGETKSIMIGGTPTGIYGMQFNDTLQDNNTYQRPQITNTVKQDIGGGNVVANGGMPITFAKDPKIAKLQREYALPIEGGGWYVPRDMVARYKKQFPK